MFDDENGGPFGAEIVAYSILLLLSVVICHCCMINNNDL